MVGAALALGVLVTIGLGEGAGGGLDALLARPGSGEVELSPPASRPPTEPGSALLSLADPPPDAPWLTEDGAPWQGDVTLEPGGGGAPAPERPVAPVPLGEDDGWRIDLGSDAVAAVVDLDRLVVATEGGVVVALDRRSGVPDWEVRLDAGVVDLAPLEDAVLAQLADGRAVVAELPDGRLRWQHAPSGFVDRVQAIGSTAGAALLVTGSPDRPELSARDPDDGRRRWTRPLTGPWLGSTSRAVAAPVGVVDRTVVRFTVDTGERSWELALQPGEELLEAVGGLVLLRGPEGYRWIDAEQGRVLFLSNRALGSWLALPDGAMVLAGRGSQPLLLVIERDGTERWRRQLPGGTAAGCCVQLTQVSDELLLVNDRRGSPAVAVIDLASGDVRADLTGLEDADGRHVIGATERVAVVAGASGTIGFDLDTLTPRWRTAQQLEPVSSAPLLLRTRTLGPATGAAPGLIAPA
jgi:outer membrane protein assembly factor BamB